MAGMASHRGEQTRGMQHGYSTGQNSKSGQGIEDWGGFEAAVEKLKATAYVLASSRLLLLFVCLLGIQG